MADFTADDFDVRLPDELAKAMLDVILSFARLDTALSAWLVQAYEMPLDRGALLVENIDIANKINRLKKLYRHDGDSQTVAGLGTLKDQFDRHRHIRNTIAHATYCGTWKKDPNSAVFSPIRAAMGMAGNLEIVAIRTEQFVAAARWAGEAAEAVMTTFERLQGRIERLPGSSL